jgi:hypothetical protein
MARERSDEAIQIKLLRTFRLSRHKSSNPYRVLTGLSLDCFLASLRRNDGLWFS